MGRQSQLVNMRQFLTMPDVQLVAVCDVDAWRLETAKAAIEAAYGKQKGSGVWRGCEAYIAFRDLLARRDIDAVMISTPDHWHAPMALAAMEAGKDVSLEKPITRSIAEGRRLADIAVARKRVFRVDSEFRSLPHMIRALSYCDGMVTNWGTHLNDIAQWANNTERTGPIEIEGRGLYPAPGRLWNVLRTFEISYRFANGVQMTYSTGKPYVRFEGSEGWIQVDYPQGLAANPASILDSKLEPNAIRFPLKSDKQDFIDAVKTRGKTLEDAEVGHRTTSLCHLGHIAIQVGQKLQWDPVKERFLNSEAAGQLIDKPISTARPAIYKTHLAIFNSLTP